ncbi:lysyl oxidase homolog 2A-like [Amphiura filiformis]|uniref:lysyl oxidase homolog 2A-like n=1 Tax=Amphiura filiformis TaxID=82378 RepID=UPI003B21E5B2
MSSYIICRSLFLLCLISSVLFHTGQSQNDLSGSGAETKPVKEKEQIRTEEKPVKEKKVRLVGSLYGNPWEGRLEVLHKGKWGTVCDDGWDMDISNVVCRWLGYIGAQNYIFDSYFGQGRGDIWLDNVRCYGNETSLWKCRHNPVGENDCTHREDVGIRCEKKTLEEQKAYRRKQRLRKMKVRLTSSSTLMPASDGFLEVYARNRWRAICSDDWDITDSKVVCGMLGFPDAVPIGDTGKRQHKRKSIMLTNVGCSGKESVFGDCPMDDLKDWKSCTSKSSVQIKCKRGDLVLDAEEPMKFMRQKVNTVVEENEITPPPPEAFKSNKVEFGIQNEQPVKSRPLPWIRLRGGGNFGEGRVEVKYRGKWGTVCSKGWDKVSANVVCRQLGFGSAKELVTDGGYGQGIGPIWLNKVSCKGDEKDILDCNHGSWNASRDCTHTNDAGVKCHVPDIGVKDKVQVIGGTELSPNQGRVLIEIDNTWGTICSEGWDLFDAAVLCRQMGMGFARYALERSVHFGAPRLDILITDVQCDGSERMLQECSYRKLSVNETCPRNHRAGVVCGEYLPDILLDIHRLEESVYLQDFPEYMLQCAAEENCLSSVPASFGSRRLLRFSSAIMNRGTAAFRPFLDRYNWIWHACHVHFHSMEVFTHYDIVNHKGERVAEGHKASFCLEDVYCDSGATPYFSCEGQQGISPNCVDLYANNIDCQWIDITGVKPDSYLLRIDTNPDVLVAESDYSNNEILCQLYYNGFQVVVGGCRYVADDDNY